MLAIMVVQFRELYNTSATPDLGLNKRFKPVNIFLLRTSCSIRHGRHRTCTVSRHLECVSKTSFRAHEAIPRCATFPLYSKRHQQVVTVSRQPRSDPGSISDVFHAVYTVFQNRARRLFWGPRSADGYSSRRFEVGLGIQEWAPNGTSFEDRHNLFKGPSGGPPDPSWCRPQVFWGPGAVVGWIWGQFGFHCGIILGQMLLFWRCGVTAIS